MANMYTIPSFDQPQLPQEFDASLDGRAPGSAQRAWIKQQLGLLSGAYKPRLGQARNAAQLALAGLGGYSFGTDDPNTPQDESLNISHDPNAPLGERQRQSVFGERSAANARGMLYSSFADEAVGASLGRLSREAQGVINQYSGQISDVMGQEANERSSLIGNYLGLYGDDVRYLAENPIKVPSPEPGPVGMTPTPGAPQPNLIGQAGNLAEAYPRPQAPPSTGQTPQVSYAQFVQTHGGRSTAQLALAWKKRFAPWLL